MGWRFTSACPSRAPRRPNRRRCSTRAPAPWGFATRPRTAVHLTSCRSSRRPPGRMRGPASTVGSRRQSRPAKPSWSYLARRTVRCSTLTTRRTRCWSSTPVTWSSDPKIGRHLHPVCRIRRNGTSPTVRRVAIFPSPGCPVLAPDRCRRLCRRAGGRSAQEAVGRM